MLGHAVLLGLGQIVAPSHAASLQRVLRNFLETFPLLAAAVLAAHVLEIHNALTEWGARLYLRDRVAYVQLYAAGVPVVRSLVWNVATLGIVLFVVALFLG